jgi:hypothetical protein
LRHLLVNGTHLIADGELQPGAVAARPGQLVAPAAR